MTTTFSVLPPELLLKTFQYLYSTDLSLHSCIVRASAAPSIHARIQTRADLHACLLVCKQWYFSAMVILWRDPDLIYMASFLKFVWALQDRADWLGRFEGLCKNRKNIRPQDCFGEQQNKGRALVEVGRMGPILVQQFHIVASQTINTKSTWKSSHVRDTHLDLIGESLRDLTHLSLQECASVSEPAVCALIARLSKRLKSLDLTGCRLVGDVAVQVIARLCGKNLEHLSLRRCGFVSDRGIWDIASYCLPGKLRTLDVSWCRRVSDCSLFYLMNRCTSFSEERPLRMKGLRHSNDLRYENNVFRYTHGKSKSPFLRPKTCQLVSLSFAGCRGVTRKGLLQLLNTFSFGERKADVDFALNQAAVETLEFSCPAPPSMKAALIFHSLEQMFTLFKNLMHLCIHDAEYMDAKMLDTLVSTLGSRRGSIIPPCSRNDINGKRKTNPPSDPETTTPRLESLSLYQCRALTDKHVARLLSRCHSISKLRFTGARKLTDLAMAELGRSRCAPRLVVLDLSECTNIGDDGVSVLFKRRKFVGTTAERRKRMGSPWTWQRKENGKVYVPDSEDDCVGDGCHFESLQELSLVNCHRITVRSLLHLILCVENLKSLDISGCGDGVFEFMTPHSSYIPKGMDVGDSSDGNSSPRIRQNGMNGSDADPAATLSNVDQSIPSHSTTTNRNPPKAYTNCYCLKEPLVRFSDPIAEHAGALLAQRVDFWYCVIREEKLAECRNHYRNNVR